MEIAFHKMHGTLNDFVVFHDPTNGITLTPGQIGLICDRRAGVGADGLIAARPSDRADFFMDYINADGSIAEMCGNGIRCLAKYVRDTGLTDKDTLDVETRAGVKTLRLSTRDDGTVDRVTVDMGAPIFEPARIPVDLPDEGTPILDHPIEANGTVFRAAILSMGNPHCVITQNDDTEDAASQYGPLIEVDRVFPEKTNVEFIRVADRGRIVMRVWERGSGLTLSCGTGACASAVAARLQGLTDERVIVELPGGPLEIAWNGMDSSVLMTGPCATTFIGTLTI